MPLLKQIFIIRSISIFKQTLGWSAAT